MAIADQLKAVPTRKGNAGAAKHPSKVAAFTAETSVKPSLDERQAAIGTRRKPAGPVTASLAKAETAPQAPPDVAETPCKEPPEDE